MKWMIKQETNLFLFLEKTNGWSKTKVKSLLRYHAVLIDHHIATHLEEPLKVGQVLEIKKKEMDRDPRLHVLYEDDYLIAVDKPAGILSIRDDSKEETMYQIVSRYVKQKEHKKIFVLHRLDKETSGILIFAKDAKIKYKMQDHWNDYVTLRSYIAIVEDRIASKEGTIQTYLKENHHYHVYSTKNAKEGKLAITHYRKQKEEKGYTWLEITLETGRKNQIRVHMQELGTHIAGDKKYGARTNPFKRLGLHANKLIFVHPVTKKQITLESPLPKVLKKI